MKTMHNITLGLVSIFILANYTTQESTVEGRKKHKVNFYGTLAPRSGKKFECDNISIAGVYKQIKVYAPPGEQDDQVKHTLKVNPNSITTKIDLVETSQIRVPHPETIWTYQRKKGARQIKYVEIKINGHSYLIETSRKIICDEISKAGPIEKEILFTALKSLTIKGYRHRDPDMKKAKDKKVDCSACPCPSKKAVATAAQAA